MNYASFDSVLASWAQYHSLPLLTLYKDEQVRAFELLGKSSKLQFQIWVDPPDAQGKTLVHGWDRKKWRVDYATTLFHLAATLDRVLDEIELRDRST